MSNLGSDDAVSKQRQQYQRQIRAATKKLAEGSHALAGWIEECGPCQLEVAWERTLFESLVRAIAHQQLHGKAAETILGRLICSFRSDGFPTARQLAHAKTEKLRSCGFSAAKVEAIQGIASAELRGSIPDRSTAQQLSDAELIEQLTELRGVGRWTVEMLLIFTLGRLDVMPVDDFGVKHGLQVLLNLPDIPTRQEMARQSADWTGRRTVAAWYLWRRADVAKAAK